MSVMKYGDLFWTTSVSLGYDGVNLSVFRAEPGKAYVSTTFGLSPVAARQLANVLVAAADAAERAETACQPETA